jgi:hypothetical protein
MLGGYAFETLAGIAFHALRNTLEENRILPMDRPLDAR